MEKEKGMHKKIEKKEEKVLLFDKTKGDIGVGTVLKRIYNGITTDLLLTNKTEFPAYIFCLEFHLVIPYVSCIFPLENRYRNMRFQASNLHANSGTLNLDAFL